MAFYMSEDCGEFYIKVSSEIKVNKIQPVQLKSMFRYNMDCSARINLNQYFLSFENI